MFNVRGQETGTRPGGMGLAWDIRLLGGVCGPVGALLLNVLPVLATWRALAWLGWTEGVRGKVVAGVLAMLASAVVVVAYHSGYIELRGSDVKHPLVGNGIMSLGYILTNNPIAAVGSHIARHIAAMLQGTDQSLQLPPHSRRRARILPIAPTPVYYDRRQLETSFGLKSRLYVGPTPATTNRSRAPTTWMSTDSSLRQLMPRWRPPGSVRMSGPPRQSALVRW